MIVIMKIDMHKCAHHEPELLPGFFKNVGINAIVLTNHCDPVDSDRLGLTYKEQAREYVNTYVRCKAAGDSIGVKVFFGAEIKLINQPHQPEFLLYGISESDFLASYPLYQKTQKELYDFCNEKDIILVQAHPFRTEQGYFPADMQYVHGIEIYNPHLRFEARYEESLQRALKNNKIKPAGSDFHINEQAGLAGMVIPDYINDQFMLRDYLKEKKPIIFNKSGILFEEN